MNIRDAIQQSLRQSAKIAPVSWRRGEMEGCFLTAIRQGRETVFVFYKGGVRTTQTVHLTPDEMMDDWEVVG